MGSSSLESNGVIEKPEKWTCNGVRVTNALLAYGINYWRSNHETQNHEFNKTPFATTHTNRIRNKSYMIAGKLTQEHLP